MINDIFKKIVDKNNKETIIVVEMSGNHQSSYDSMLKFVKSSIRYGADIIKFQVYKPDTITFDSQKKDFLVKSETKKWSKYSSLYQLYNEAHTPWEWIEKITKFLESNKFPWFASVFDKTSINFLQKLKCPAYKIASPEITDIGLIEEVSKTRKPIVLSTGLAKVEDIDLAIKTIKKKHNKIAILKCTSSYPSPIEDCNLNSILFLKKKYKLPVGFSDHTIGIEASQIATSLGATIIEKHFKSDYDKTSIDSHFSMKISELPYFKEKIKNIKEYLGSYDLIIPKSAQKNLNGRRSLYVIKDMKKGEIFSRKNIKSIRPHYGLHPSQLKKILGKKAKKNIRAGTKLSNNLIVI